MRDHGGNIDWAIKEYGGTAERWIDLSTGINRVPYEVPEISSSAWTTLPTKAEIKSLINAAAKAYETQAAILPVSGAQAGIQMIPRRSAAGRAKVLGPTYNEHAASLRSAGWQVEQVTSLVDLEGADLAVVVNPNNPNGYECDPEWLLDLKDNVGQLLVDESFCDACPDISIAGFAGSIKDLYVLRSFGKFYGLAGLRLGFILGHALDIDDFSEMAGPWPVSGPAIEVGRVALGDIHWGEMTIKRLRREVIIIDSMAKTAGWHLIGGTELFRLYETGDAKSVQHQLAQKHIWTRIFPWSDGYVRLGLPGSDLEWDRLNDALKNLNKE